MAKISTFPIDRRAFEHELRTRDLPYQTVSMALGYNPNYVSEIIYQGKIRVSAAVVLDKLYGIKRENYEQREPEPVQQELVVRPDSIMTDQDWARLYRLMVEAFREVLNG